MLVRGWWERKLELVECFLLNLTKQKRMFSKPESCFFCQRAKTLNKSHKMDFLHFRDLLIYALKSMMSFKNVFLLKGLKTPKPK